MEQVLLDQIIALRAQLHACAEVSGREVVTKHTLLTFLREHTSLELHELAGGFYAAHREPEGTKPTVALRADYDALATPEGGAAHLCGHDGHAAALCGVALMLEGQSIGHSVFLLFQGTEETGAGAALCCELFDREKVDEIYGAHNLPGFPFGAVLTRAQELAHKNHLEFSFEEQDIFPATENDALYASRVMRVCRGTLLHDPMRWSEDFGHYLHRCRGAFFGVGAGEDHPQIHTEHYEYPDALLEPTVEAFRALLTSE